MSEYNLASEEGKFNQNLINQVEEIKKGNETFSRELWVNIKDSDNNQQEVKETLVRSRLLEIVSKLNSFSHTFIENSYKGMQDVETMIIESKSKYLSECKKRSFLLHQKNDTENKIKAITEEIEKNQNDMKEESKDHDLNRISMIWFFLLMAIFAATEIVMYQKVFIIQESGDAQDLLPNIAAYGLASGFTVMIIWMAHLSGNILRHLNPTKDYEVTNTQAEVPSRIVKFLSLNARSLFLLFVILFVSMASMAAVAHLRASIIEQDIKKVELSKIQQSKVENIQSDNTEREIDELDGSKDSPSSVTVEKVERKFGNEFMQSQDAYYFTGLNVFIFVAGIFLAYKTHTSSPKYEEYETKDKQLNNYLNSLKAPKGYLKFLVKFGFYENTLYGIAKRIEYHQMNQLISAIKVYVEAENEYDKRIMSLKHLIDQIAVNFNVLTNHLFSSLESKFLVYNKEVFNDEKIKEIYESSKLLQDIEKELEAHKSRFDSSTLKESFNELICCQEFLNAGESND